MSEPKQVPLVVYQRGVRTPIGMAQINEDGSITGQIEKDQWPLVKDVFIPMLGELSLNPTPQPKIVNTPYHGIPKI